MKMKEKEKAKEIDSIHEQVLEITKAVKSIREEYRDYTQLIKIARHCPSCRALFKKYLENKSNVEKEGSSS